MSRDASRTTAGPAALQVSVVMPCLNEEGAVADCVHKALAWMGAAGRTGEVIVVDNGSTDRSAELASGAGARVVAEPQPGYGSAIRRGFRDAQGAYLVMGDCDGTYDFGRLGPLVDPLDDGYDMVVGNRLSGSLARGAMPWLHRFIGTPLISAALRLFTGAKISDSQCGLRSIRRDAAERLQLRTTGMEFASEMILKATRQGLRVTEVPIAYDVRVGESKLSTFRDGWRHLRFLLISSPSMLFVAPGLVFVLLGLVSLAITVLGRGGVNVGSLEWQPVFAASIFLVVGINALYVGLLAGLLAVRAGEDENQVVRFYRRWLGLERLLGLSIAAIVIGGALDAFALVQWLNHSGVDLIPPTALGQAFLLLGSNSLFGALAAAMVEDTPLGGRP